MKIFRLITAISIGFISLSLSACSGTRTAPLINTDPLLNQVTGAEYRYAVTRGITPLLNTHNWDDIFGTSTGEQLRYDRFGEIDEVQYILLPQTPLNLQRQTRKKTRKGVDTIYFRVSSPDLPSSTPLWVDGRFLDIKKTPPTPPQKKALNPLSVLQKLRSAEGVPYTWNGASIKGVPELLTFYPPKTSLSDRQKDDWQLKGFGAPGLLHWATEGQTPLTLEALSKLGSSPDIQLDLVSEEEKKEDTLQKRASRLMDQLKPLDVLLMDDRVWIVLDNRQVIESKYGSKFAGKVSISSLYDTCYGLLQKANLVSSLYAELPEGNKKRFSVRRFFNPFSHQESNTAPEEEINTNPL